ICVSAPWSPGALARRGRANFLRSPRHWMAGRESRPYRLGSARIRQTRSVVGPLAKVEPRSLPGSARRDYAGYYARAFSLGREVTRPSRHCFDSAWRFRLLVGVAPELIERTPVTAARGKQKMPAPATPSISSKATTTAPRCYFSPQPLIYNHHR